MSILDESEMYKRQTPFTLDQLADIARFGNHMVHACVWNSIIRELYMHYIRGLEGARTPRHLTLGVRCRDALDHE